MHQANFPSFQRKTSQPFELVRSNVWGPSHTASMDGYRYYLHFVDDFTRFTWIFPLKVKSKCLKLFAQFHTFVERQFNYKFKCLQTNWGGEFRPFLPILSNLGIQFRHPCPHVHQQHGKAERKHCPHVHQQHGKAERKHQHIIELGLTLLAQAQLPFKFWFHAFVSAVFLINRLPTSTLNKKFLFKRLFQIFLTMHLLRVFGYACYPF